MDDKRKSFMQIEPLDEEGLEKDLRFLFQNRSDTVDLFLEEAIPVMKYHVNEVIARYQERLLHELTESLRGDIAGIILRVRRETVFHPNTPIGRVLDDKEEGEDESLSW